MKHKKKSKWQTKREEEVSKNSQFDPRIHQLGKEGYGFQMKRDYKEKPGESNGSVLKKLFDKWT